MSNTNTLTNIYATDDTEKQAFRQWLATLTNNDGQLSILQINGDSQTGKTTLSTGVHNLVTHSVNWVNELNATSLNGLKNLVTTAGHPLVIWIKDFNQPTGQTMANVNNIINVINNVKNANQTIKLVLDGTAEIATIDNHNVTVLRYII